MNRLIQLVVTVSLLLIVAGSVIGRDYFVDQRHPQADDKNPGSEDKPFKTIQPAVDAAKPGDIVYVKAGVYSDVVTIRSYGSPYHPNVLTGWKDDQVIIGSEVRDLPPADQWKPIAGHKSFQVQLPEGTPPDPMVILDGKAIVTQYKDTVPADDVYNWAHYRKSDRTLMVNTGDGNPAAIHKLQFARDVMPFRVSEMGGYWCIKKLEFAWCRDGVGMDGTGVMLEDCFFHDTYRAAIYHTGRMGTIRRCNFVRCLGGVFGQHGIAGTIEDCLFVQCGGDANDDIDCRVTGQPEGGGVLRFTGGPVVGGIIRYNIIADCKGAIWHDCAGSGLRIIGNAFWSNVNGNGIYNEYGIMDTFVMGNFFYRTGVASSWSARMSVVDNFFSGGNKEGDWGCGIGWANRDVWPLKNTFMTARNNAFTNIHLGYIAGSDHGTDGLYPEGFARAFVDYNRVRMSPNEASVLFHGSKFTKTFEDVQKTYGWDLHGDLNTWKLQDNDLTPESMGGTSVTFRVPWGPRSHLARPMLSDNHLDGKWPAAVEYAGARFPSFFWRFADGNCDEKTLNRLYPDMTSDRLWKPNADAGYDVGTNSGAAWYIEGDDTYPDPKMHIEKPYNRAENTNGNRWLVVQGIKPQDMPPSGVGWWTAWLAACPGAKTTVSFKVRGKDIVSTDKASPVVYMQYISATGQQVKREYLIGRGEAQLGDAASVHHRDSTRGTFGWTEVKETITPPDTAVRMALFLGMQPCKGEVGYDDIDIQTADGELPLGEAEIVEALPPDGIPKERMREIFYLDLSKVANRSLASPAAGDGKGWTDQGPDVDMRKLPTGQQSYGGVPFQLLSGDKAVLVLKGNGKAGANLPQEVTIPVGRKMEALFILHANTLLDPKLQSLLDVTVEYKDGSKSRFGFGSNILADWLAPPMRKFTERSTTAALTVPVGKDKKGTIYRTEWVLDRAKHDVPVESVIFHGTSDGVPIILGLTGVLEW